MSEKIMQLKDIIKKDPNIGAAYKEAEGMTRNISEGKLSVPESFKELLKNRDASPEMIDRAIAELQ